MTWNWRGARRARRQNVFNYICRCATALGGGTALITACWTAAVIKHVEQEETVELLEQARPGLAAGEREVWMWISWSLARDCGLNCCLSACRACVCVMSNNEVQCGELMKFFLHWGQFAPLSGDLGGENKRG